MSAQTSSKLARQIFLRTMNPGRPIPGLATRIVDVMEDLRLPAGSVIYRQGQAPERIYFIVSGTVALRTEGQDDWTFNERSVIGIIDANLDRPRARSAIATTDVHLLAVRVDDYLEAIEDNFEQQRGITYNIAQGLRSLHQELAPDGGYVEPAAVMLEPIELKPLTAVERIITIRDVGAFRRASIQAVTAIAEIVKEVRVAAGPLDLRPGGKNGTLIIVARGAVEMVRGKVTAKFAARTMVGGSASINDDTPDVKVTALVPSILLKLGEEDLFDVMEDHFDVTRSLLADTSLERERMLPLRVRRSKPM